MKTTTCTFIIEVPDFILVNYTPAEAKRMERKILGEMEGMIRNYLRVGPYSKAVRSRIERPG